MIPEHMILESSLKHIGYASNTLMNTQSSSKKMWIWIIVIIVIGGGAYFYFSGSSSSQDTGSIGVAPTDASTADQSQVLSLLNQIRQLKIDSKFFIDPAYLQLMDYAVPIPEKGVGRDNPFAPLPGEVSKAKTTTPAH